MKIYKAINSSVYEVDPVLGNVPVANTLKSKSAISGQRINLAEEHKFAQRIAEALNDLEAKEVKTKDGTFVTVTEKFSGNVGDEL